MNLDGQQTKQLQNALLSAFPNKAALQQMVRFGLNRNLDAIASGDNYAEVVFHLIEWAMAHSMLGELVTASRKENPDNQLLHALALSLSSTSLAGSSTTGSMISKESGTILPEVNPFERKRHVDDMIGRERELESVVHQLRGHNHCSIIGPPGSGKSLLIDCVLRSLPQQLGWESNDWFRINFLSVTRLEELQRIFISERGKGQFHNWREVLRSSALRLLVLEDIEGAIPIPRSYRMRMWLRAVAEDFDIQILVSSHDRLEIVFRGDPTTPSPFAHIFGTPIKLNPLSAETCSHLVAQCLIGTPFHAGDFTDLFTEPRYPRQLLKDCASRYNELTTKL